MRKKYLPAFDVLEDRTSPTNLLIGPGTMDLSLLHSARAESSVDSLLRWKSDRSETIAQSPNGIARVPPPTLTGKAPFASPTSHRTVVSPNSLFNSLTQDNTSVSLSALTSMLMSSINEIGKKFSLYDEEILHDGQHDVSTPIFTLMSGGGGIGGGGGLELNLIVPWNVDNDNGSPNPYYIPELRDHLANPADYNGEGEIENDLVLLNFNWIPVIDPDGEHVGSMIPYYKVTLSQTGQGRIELWDSATKHVKVSYNQTDWTPGVLPNIYAEGLNPSDPVKDIHVTVHTKFVYPSMDGHADY